MKSTAGTVLHVRAHTANDDSGWRSARVSRYSRAGDPVWQLEPDVPGQTHTTTRIKWTLSHAPEFKASRATQARLVDACKQFLLLMTINAVRRRRWSKATLCQYGRLLQVILKWMFIEGVPAFAAMDAACLDRLRAWLSARPGRGRDRPQISQREVFLYMEVLTAFHLVRNQLVDAPAVHPAPYVAGQRYTPSETEVRRIPAIPDEIAVRLLSAALEYVEHHSEAVLKAWKMVDEVASDSTCDVSRSYWVRKHLRRNVIMGPDGHRLRTKVDVVHAVRWLRTACIIVIGGLVGMRLSEILALRDGAIETRTDSLTGEQQTYVVSRLFKTREASGREERWIAPAPVVRAIDVMQSLSARLRRLTGKDDLFIVKSRTGRFDMLSSNRVGALLDEFAEKAQVPLHEGRRWQFSSHQLRKTFARFVAKRDRSHLLALAQHFKHVSLVITSRSYVGTDFELRELIDADAREDAAVALDNILSGEPLAGKMGERIMAKGAMFRGRAGTQVRKDYIEFVMRETDLSLHACEYGWCVFQAEVSRCGGERGPNEALRSPETCLSCANMVIEPKHAPYWRDRRERNAELLPVASLLAKAALNEAIEQCDRVLRNLEEHRGQAESDDTSGHNGPCGADVPGGARKVAARPRSTSKARWTGGADNAGGGRARGSKKPKSVVHDAP